MVAVNVSKKFKIPVDQQRTIFGRLKSILNKERKYVEFWALKDISFKVKKGEFFGIIGPNGSGKSTLLKVISGILYPDRGTIITSADKLVAIIELGAGFLPQLTVEENIYLYGVIIGLTRGEIRRLFDKILEFSGLVNFRKMKLSNLSSGMIARLAFSIAALSDPDLLLLDETLAVGDMEFQERSVKKIRELNDSGTTILFVSHSLDLVSQLCDRVLVLNRGKKEFLGDPKVAVEIYKNAVGRSQ